MATTAFASLADVIAVSGQNYTQDEQERITALLPLLSDALRLEGDRVGMDLDQKAITDARYANLLKLVLCDIVIRAMRQSSSGEPMAQESQSALGYSWSGTYAIPGGGFAQAIMKNDLKRLGIRRQRMGVIDLWPSEE